jgi:N-acetylglutamate synthase-like GNAT family acetyltransferase
MQPIQSEDYHVPFMPRMSLRVPVGPAEVTLAEATINVYRIRYLRPSDVAKCAKVADEVGFDMRRAVYQIEEGFRSEAGPKTFVCQSGDVIAGFASVRESWMMPKTAEIIWVGVKPKHQGEGIGQALVEHCIKLAASYGSHDVMLCTYRPGWFEHNFDFKSIDAGPFGVVMRRNLK